MLPVSNYVLKEGFHEPCLYIPPLFLTNSCLKHSYEAPSLRILTASPSANILGDFSLLAYRASTQRLIVASTRAHPGPVPHPSPAALRRVCLNSTHDHRETSTRVNRPYLRAVRSWPTLDRSSSTTLKFTAADQHSPKVVSVSLW